MTSGAISTKPPRGERGATAVEFALVVPILLLMIAMIFKLGLVLNAAIEVNEGVREGARTLAVSRHATTPFTSTVAAVRGATSSLNPSSLTVAVNVNNTPCVSDLACSTLLSTDGGGPSSVTASYPCNMNFLSFNLAPNGCTLSAQSTMRVE
jgi:Flp pilus assembly protein TadG